MTMELCPAQTVTDLIQSLDRFAKAHKHMKLEEVQQFLTGLTVVIYQVKSDAEKPVQVPRDMVDIVVPDAPKKRKSTLDDVEYKKDHPRWSLYSKEAPSKGFLSFFGYSLKDGTRQDRLVALKTAIMAEGKDAVVVRLKSLCDKPTPYSGIFAEDLKAVMDYEPPVVSKKRAMD